MANLVNFIKKNNKAMVVLLITLMATILYKDFIFGNLSMFYRDIGSDTFDSYLPYHTYFIDLIRGMKIPSYSFYFGTGQNIYTAFTMLMDPFNLVFVLFRIPFYRGITYVHILKVILTGLFAYMYLGKITKTNFSRMAGSIAMAFNGWIILWGQHFFMGSFFVFLPLTLYFLESYIQDKKFYGLIFINAFLMSINLYLYYQFAFYLVFYFMIRVYQEGTNLKEFSVRFGKLLVLILASFGISSIFTLPVYEVISNSSRTGGNIADILNVLKSYSIFKTPQEYLTILLRFVTNNGLGTTAFIGNANYYEAPILYSSILCLILLPQAIACSKEKVLRRLYIILTIVPIVLLGLYHFSYLFNGFSNNAMRWTFNIILLNIFLLVKILDNFEIIKLRVLNITGTIIISILAPLIYIDVLMDMGNLQAIGINPNGTSRELTLVIIIIVAYIIVMNSSLSLNKRKAAIMMLLIMEVMILSAGTIYSRTILTLDSISSVESGYYERDTNEILGHINDTEKDLFYRVDKDYFSGFLTDPMIMKYRGVTMYNSIPNDYYKEFMKTYDINNRGFETLYFDMPNEREGIFDFLGIKYLVTKQGNNGKFDRFDENEDVKAFVNSDAYKIGFLLTNKLGKEEVLNMPSYARDMSLKYAFYTDDNSNLDNEYGRFSFTATEEPVTIIGHENISTESSDYPFIFTASNHDPIIYVDFDRSKFEKDPILNINVVSNMDTWCQIYYKSDVEQFSDENSILVPIAAGENQLQIPVPNAVIRVDIGNEQDQSFVINNIFLENYRFEDTQYPAQMEVTEMNEDNIKGIIDADQDGMMVFSIPYEKSWNVLVDGNFMDVVRINDGFIGVEIKSGHHNIQLDYIIVKEKVGMYVTIASLLLMSGYYIFSKKRVK